MSRLFLLLAACLLLPHSIRAQSTPAHALVYQQMPQKWQDAFPMGNGLLGCLVWQKNGRLRLALDRADLWDLRPMAGLDRPEFNYQWVAAQVAGNNYQQVQEYFDLPYEQEVGPSKIPGGAIELGRIDDSPLSTARLDISNGVTEISWKNGRKFETFVHAGKREGWFRCSGFPDPESCLQLLVPAHSETPFRFDDSEPAGGHLYRLGYPRSQAFQRRGVWLFHQSGWGGFSYEIAVAVKQVSGNCWEAVWSISSHFPQKPELERAETAVRKSIKRGFDASRKASENWWRQYWAQSGLQLPDTLLERQYYLDLYKLGCTARENGPMISLQAIWTADNGDLPPWKGDLHHDLNTQMSYWPVYTSNHLSEGLSYLKHLESNEAAHRAYTKKYFGVEGLNIPGVSTLLGAEMGGWIQYACSPTTAAWCAQHFYLHWRYSQDRKFLRDHAWPMLQQVATFLVGISYLDAEGRRVLPLSSSPEINDNSIHAWFANTWTNYDLALARFVFEKTAELALEMKLPLEAEKWKRRLAELPALETEPGKALNIAPNWPYERSHRHFSHLMAIYPLGLLDWARAADRPVIAASIDTLRAIGPSGWMGYSWAWQASLCARRGDGDGARNALQIFASAFVSRNSFHLNGDQSGKGYSSATYDPFTLEGNFAFAAGVQEMLLQSHNGCLRIFPAVPADWQTPAFQHFRAEGGFVVSAAFNQKIEIQATCDAPLLLEFPPGKWRQEGGGLFEKQWSGRMKKNARVVFTFEKP